MKFEVFGDLRYVACKYAGCSESIPLPSRSLLIPTAIQPSTDGVFLPVYLACMICGHVYEYTPSDIQSLGAGGTLGLDPEKEPHHGAAELPCGPSCRAPATIHVPTYASGDRDALRKLVSKLKLVDVFCRHRKRIANPPPVPTVLFYS
jgi:hypothetical protein